MQNGENYSDKMLAINKITNNTRTYARVVVTFCFEILHKNPSMNHFFAIWDEIFRLKAFKNLIVFNRV